MTSLFFGKRETRLDLPTFECSMLRRSKESIRFLQAWINHRDCECWVDQGLQVTGLIKFLICNETGAYYIETLRWISRSLMKNDIFLHGKEINNVREGGKSCDEK